MAIKSDERNTTLLNLCDMHAQVINSLVLEITWITFELECVYTHTCTATVYTFTHCLWYWWAGIVNEGLQIESGTASSSDT